LIYLSISGPHQQSVTLDKLIHEISGCIVDLDVPNLILVNRNITATQKIIDERSASLKQVLDNLEDPIDLNNDSIAATLSQILNCSPISIKNAYSQFYETLKLKETEFFLDEKAQPYSFTDSNATEF
jgi:hypothetical protein